MQTTTLQKRKKPLYQKVGFALIKAIEKVVGAFSKIGDTNIFKPTVFDWVPRIESEWKTIRIELENLLKYADQLPTFQEISKDQVSITRDNNWKTFFLYGYGFRSDAACELCPDTARIVESIPGMKTAFFSILSPGKHIPAHRGPFKGVVRYHLGLIVPEPKEQCRIRVHNDIIHWEEGKSLVFDDTYEHEVWNETTGRRVVLFLDIERPMLWPFNWLNKLVIKLISISPFIKNAEKNQRAWEKRFEEFRKKQAA